MDNISKVSKIQNELIEFAKPEGIFYTKSYLHTYLVNLLINKQVQGIKTNFEMLCEEIPKRVGSRSAILVALHEGLASGFLEKKRSEKDKRLRIYSVNESFTKHLDSVADRFFNLTENEKVL